MDQVYKDEIFLLNLKSRSLLNLTLQFFITPYLPTNQSNLFLHYLKHLLSYQILEVIFQYEDFMGSKSLYIFKNIYQSKLFSHFKKCY
jgi:hypothetical protein